MVTRRSSRSRRALASATLLISAVLVATIGILVSTVPVLVAATVYAVASGIVAAWLLSKDVAHMRRDWARDRARIADEGRRAAITRSREHIAFVNQMGSRVRLRDTQISALRDSVVTAEIELARARERLSAERARSEALESDLGSAKSDLESARVDLRRASDALAASETAEMQARAELLAWEEASSDELREQQHRKLA